MSAVSQPLTSARPIQSAESEPPRMKVLMAEDSTPMRILLNSQLSGWGLEVIAARNGAEAWDKFLEYEPSLVLTDWIMPEMDGLELIRRIKQHRIDHYVYVILLTAKSDKDDLIHAMDAGADDFLVKPCDNQELRVRLREGTRILDLEQKLAERNLEIRQAQAALVQHEKLAGLGQLAAGMAHEINNPIAYVSNNLTVLQRDVDSLLSTLATYQSQIDLIEKADPNIANGLRKSERDNDLDWIKENTPAMFQSSISGIQRVRDIVKSLREFARLDEAEIDTIQLGDAIRSVMMMMQHEVETQRINLTVHDHSNPSVQCRVATVNQMLHNVLVNAVQACQSGGDISVVIRADSENAIIEMTDTGHGIAPKNLPRIFEPFFTTRPIGTGSGLGLSLAYGVARDHGGDIHVTSELNRGTTVTITLPRQSKLPLASTHFETPNAAHD